MDEKEILKHIKKAFCQEIIGEKYSISNKISKELIDLGLVEQYKELEGDMMFYFHRLTHQGYYFYTSKCKKTSKD